MKTIKNNAIRNRIDILKQTDKQNYEKIWEIENSFIELEEKLESYKNLIYWLDQNTSLDYHYYRTKEGDNIPYIQVKGTNDFYELDEYLEDLYDEWKIAEDWSNQAIENLFKY